MTATIALRGTRIAYSDHGSGPLVVRAHGVTQTRHTDHDLGLIDWDLLAEAGYRVVSYDARGHGSSGGAAHPGDYTWGSLAADLLALLDHLSPHEPVRAIGTSMGTATILSALTMAPERFASVVLGAPPTAWSARIPQSAMYEKLARAAESLTGDEVAAMLAQAPVPPIFAGIEGWVSATDVRHSLLPAVLRGAALSDLPSPDAVAALETPALILTWGTDPAHPVATARHLADLLPHSALHVSESAADLATWPTLACAHFRAGHDDLHTQTKEKR